MTGRPLIFVAAMATWLASPAASQEERETITSLQAVAAFDRICLQTAGNRPDVSTALIQTGGYNVTGADSAQTTARHTTHGIDVVVMGAGPSYNCVVRYAPTAEVTEAYFATLASLIEVLGVTEGDFEQSGMSMIYAAPTGPVVLRGGSMLTLAITYE